MFVPPPSVVALARVRTQRVRVLRPPPPPSFAGVTSTLRLYRGNPDVQLGYLKIDTGTGVVVVTNCIQSLHIDDAVAVFTILESSLLFMSLFYILPQCQSDDSIHII